MFIILALLTFLVIIAVDWARQALSGRRQGRGVGALPPARSPRQIDHII